MTFRVGQKVVCIKRGPWKLLFNANDNPNPSPPQYGQIFEIHEISVTAGVEFLVFREYPSDEWKSSRFRPLVSEQDDIAMFNAIADGALNPVVPPAVVPPRVVAHQT